MYVKAELDELRNFGRFDELRKTANVKMSDIFTLKNWKDGSSQTHLMFMN